MFVIFPADELLLMTYGAAAIPRISSRPTLDCLREPQVPIVFPAHFKIAKKTLTEPIGNHIAHTSYNNPKINYDLPQVPEEDEPEPDPEPEPEPEPVPKPINLSLSVTESQLHRNFVEPTSYNLYSPSQPQPQPQPQIQPQSFNSQYTPRSSLKRSTPVAIRRGSTRQPTIAQSQGEFYNYNYPIMQQQQQQQQQQQPLPPPLQQQLPLPGMRQNLSNLSGNASFNYDDYQHMERRRSRSPSILIEPATPTRLQDPTQPVFGPGWGRPMSPMDLPPDPSKSPTGSKSRLRPKLHIPLGRLGRSVSSDQKESHRLREDLHLQVENPIFNSENLRQRNFDAFFESGEPVYKLQTTSPHTAPADSSSMSSYSTQALDKYAGVYDSSPRGTRGRTTPDSSLFAKSPKENVANARSKSVDKYESLARNKHSGSVCGDGAPQKGDRCPKKNNISYANQIVSSCVAFFLYQQKAKSQ